jgi:hypothetical protein
MIVDGAQLMVRYCWAVSEIHLLGVARCIFNVSARVGPQQSIISDRVKLNAVERRESNIKNTKSIYAMAFSCDGSLRHNVTPVKSIFSV